MALQFPKNPEIINGTNVVVGNQIERTWQYNYGKNRWELVGFDSVSFDAELPVTNYKRNGDIVHDFDIQDLNKV